ncbi:MAG: HK97 family phage prohead protease [Thalassovita sp.]
MTMDSGLEMKFSSFGNGLSVTDQAEIEGYASYFGQPDQGNDVVQKGAYAHSLAASKRTNRAIKMLWQHDPAQPIGIWTEVREDDTGLYVKGRLLESVSKGREAIELIRAGAIDGLSIGYRTKRAKTSDKGQRVLTELELWEVSLVTFPMLPEARVGAKSTVTLGQELRDITALFESAKRDLLAQP